MSTSTDGILFYGYIWTDEDFPPQFRGYNTEAELWDSDGDREWIDLLAEKQGIANPWTMPEGLNDSQAGQWIADHRSELDAYFAAIAELENSSSCSIGWHCSGDYGMPYVYVKRSHMRASRGYPEAIDDENIACLYRSEADNELQGFLNALGIEPPEGQQPGWWLTSYWG